MSLHLAHSARTRATNLLRSIANHPPSCPCHGNPSHHHHDAKNIMRRLATPSGPSHEKEYAFEMAGSSVRFGPGVTREVGMDFKNLGAKRVMVLTDPNVAKLPVLQTALNALERSGIKYDLYKDVRCEPKDTSVKHAIEYGKRVNADAFLAVGGGSVIDTAKMVNLYTTYHEAGQEVAFEDFVNAPVGKGLPIERKLKPLIAATTTSGTASEVTGTAIFDIVGKSKTGIASRALKPTLGICDPLSTFTMPAAVVASSGLDVMFHSLESYTAIPFNQRTPRPVDPIQRPAYQGSNPISDIFALEGLRMTVKYLQRAVKNPDDYEAREQMLLAATLAGVGFGNAGVHLCHGMSYPISSQNPGYKHAGYEVPDAIVPHGVSVAVTAPAVFRFTASSNYERHRTAAKIFGADVDGKPDESIGEILAEAIQKFLVELGDQPRGLKALGYSRADIPRLVEGSLPQRRVLMLAPGMKEANSSAEREDLERLFEDALEY